MCGIAGYLGSKIFLPNKSLIKNCSRLMRRRGPDNVNHKIILISYVRTEKNKI